MARNLMTTTKRNLAGAALLLGVSTAIFTGCTNTQNTYTNDKPNFHAHIIKDHRIETDAFLADRASVLEVRQGVAQDNLMKIDVEVMNTDSWDGNVQYKFEWFDDQGMIVESPISAWTSQHMGAKEILSLSSIAPSPKCKDFRLKLQRTPQND